MKTLTTIVIMCCLVPVTLAAQQSPPLPTPSEPVPQTGAVHLAPIVKPPLALPDLVPPEVPSPYGGSGMQFPSSPCIACQFDPAAGHCKRCGKCRTGWWQTQAKPSLQKSHWGYCDLFCERPLGSLVNMHMGAMVNNGIQDQMALYAYDFQNPLSDNAAELSGRGQYELRKLAILLQQGFGPLMIETTNPSLDAARRENVIQQLVQLGVNIEPGQVMFRARPLQQLTGQEALPIQARNLQLMTSGGGSAGTAGAGSATPAISTGTNR